MGRDGRGRNLHPGADTARRTIDIVFDGKPDLAALRAAVAQQHIAGAFVRVRWTVADEDRHEVDRGAIQRELAAAADVQLECRIVPVVLSRAAGISQMANLADKVCVWADATQAKPGPLLRCLEALASETPDAIAVRALRGSLPGTRVEFDADAPQALVAVESEATAPA